MRPTREESWHDRKQRQSFTAEEIKAVREAIKAAKRDMDEWRKATRVSPEQMRRPMTI